MFLSPEKAYRITPVSYVKTPKPLLGFILPRILHATVMASWIWLMNFATEIIRYI